jgi:hypothetical protein
MVQTACPDARCFRYFGIPAGLDMSATPEQNLYPVITG